MQALTKNLIYKQYYGGLVAHEIGSEERAGAVKELIGLLFLSLLLAGLGAFSFLSIDQLMGGLSLEISGFCILG